MLYLDSNEFLSWQLARVIHNIVHAGLREDAAAFIPSGQGHRHPCAAPTAASLGRGDPGPGCPRGLCGATRCRTLPRARLALGVLPPSRFLLTVLNSCTLVCFIHPRLPIFFFPLTGASVRLKDGKGGVGD